MKVLALDQRKRMASERMRQWPTKVSRWYSSSSNRTQKAVAPPSTPAEIFLFLQRKTSAAATVIRIKIINLGGKIKLSKIIFCNKDRCKIIEVKDLNKQQVVSKPR